MTNEERKSFVVYQKDRETKFQFFSAPSN